MDSSTTIICKAEDESAPVDVEGVLDDLVEIILSALAQESEETDGPPDTTERSQ